MKVDYNVFAHKKAAIGQHAHTITSEQYTALRDLLTQKRLMPPDPPGEADMSRPVDLSAVIVGGTPEESAAAQQNLTGTYVVYRFSHHLRRRRSVLRGTITFTPDPSGAIATTERYSVQRIPKVTAGNSFNRTGRLLYRDPLPVILSRKDGRRDFQVIHIHQMQPANAGTNPARISWMYGVLTDWEGMEMYTTRIYILDEGKVVNRRGFVRAIKIDEAPEVVREYLVKPFDDTHPHLIKF